MASDAEVRERNVVRVLRGLVAVVLALALLAVVLDTDYAIFAGALIVPSSWVFWRPQWAQLVTWIMCTVPLVMLGTMIHIGKLERLTTPSALQLGSACVLILIVMPLVRWTHRSPRVPRPKPGAKLPVARALR
jgi:hypothetical protein